MKWTATEWAKHRGIDRKTARQHLQRMVKRGEAIQTQNLEVITKSAFFSKTTTTERVVRYELLTNPPEKINCNATKLVA